MLQADLVWRHEMRQAPLRPSWSGLELMKCLGRDHVRGRPYTYDSITVTSRRVNTLMDAL